MSCMSASSEYWNSQPQWLCRTRARHWQPLGQDECLWHLWTIDYCSSDYVHTIFILCSNYFHTMYILFSYYFHSMFILFQRLKHECLKSLKHYRNHALLRPKKVAAKTAWMMSMKVNSYHCNIFFRRHFRGVLHHFCWDSLLSNSDPRSHGSDQWTSRAVGHCHGHVGLSLANPRDNMNRAQWVSHCRVDQVDCFGVVVVLLLMSVVVNSCKMT